MSEIQLTLTLKFSAPVHHGSGDGIVGIVDRAFRRDSQGLPYLAGSAIKGKLRFGALQALSASGQRLCPPSGPPCRSAPCALCEIFGSARRQGVARFSDAYPDQRDWLREAAQHSPSVLMAGPTAVRSTTAINRQTQSAQHQHLFSTETILPFVIFQGQVLGPLSTHHVELLQHSAKLLYHFGADSARGLGFCSCELKQEPAA